MIMNVWNIWKTLVYMVNVCLFGKMKNSNYFGRINSGLMTFNLTCQTVSIIQYFILRLIWQYFNESESDYSLHKCFLNCNQLVYETNYNKTYRYFLPPRSETKGNLYRRNEKYSSYLKILHTRLRIRKFWNLDGMSIIWESAFKG